MGHKIFLAIVIFGEFQDVVKTPVDRVLSPSKAAVV